MMGTPNAQQAAVPPSLRPVVGAVMAAGTLIVLEASLPGGALEGLGSLGYGQTTAFTTLRLFQLFNVVNARSDERSAFSELFAKKLAVGGNRPFPLLLHVFVLYVPFLQRAFSTVSLSAGDWLVCAAAASSVLCRREASKLQTRGRPDAWPRAGVSLRRSVPAAP